jgi:hypothetical protein
MNFEPFPKIGRLQRGICITEKIDGTNAQISLTPWTDACNDAVNADGGNDVVATSREHSLVMRVGSRTRWITPGKATDNFGFAGWCKDNASELFNLGEGRHFGEWWGGSIQRGYGIGEKRFSLFNVNRWADGRDERPSCCGVVPILYRGLFDQMQISDALASLALDGSRAAPGFMQPEGIVVYHEATKTLFKQTLKDDEQPKGQVQ